MAMRSSRSRPDLYVRTHVRPHATALEKKLGVNLFSTALPYYMGTKHSPCGDKILPYCGDKARGIRVRFRLMYSSSAQLKRDTINKLLLDFCTKRKLYYSLPRRIIVVFSFCLLMLLFTGDFTSILFDYCYGSFF